MAELTRSRALRRALFVALVAGWAGLAVAADAQAPPKAPVNVGPGEMGIDALIVDGPPITADQVMGPQHARYPRGMNCAECHQVKFEGVDVVTTASQQFQRNFRNLSQPEIWEKIVAFLHDTVEDGHATFEQLRRMGFTERVIEAVDCLTRRKGESYEAFVDRIAPNALARVVKLADLEDNMDVRRSDRAMKDKDAERMEKYRRAWQKLAGLVVAG